MRDKQETYLLMKGTADFISTQILVFSGMAAFMILLQEFHKDWYVPK